MFLRLCSALNDSDDEVRDRAAVCLYYLHQDEKTMHTFLMEGDLILF